MEEVKELTSHMPRIGESAPAFEATADTGTLKFEDFKRILCYVNRKVSYL